MCRHLAYVGAPVTVGSAVYDAPHCLVQQSYAPRDMRGGGTVSVDGFGVGWFRADGSIGRYRRAVPIWQDATFPDTAAHTVSGGFVAAVRGASPGMGSAETACAPFTDGRWLFSLNGRVAGWPVSIAPLAASLPTTTLMTLEAPTDAVVIWSLLSRQLDDGVEPGAALAGVVGAVAEAADGSRLNTLLSDGRTVWATTWVHSLWSHRSPSGTYLASEPLDADPGWAELGDRQLVVADAGGVRSTPLDSVPTITRTSERTGAPTPS